MIITKTDLLNKAVEIAKESTRGGFTSPEVIIEDCYNKLVEIAERDGIL